MSCFQPALFSIYISDMQYLYIQYHRYIDARRGKMKEKRSAFLIQMIEHIGHSYYQLRCVRKPKKQLFLLLQEIDPLQHLDNQQQIPLVQKERLYAYITRFSHVAYRFRLTKSDLSEIRLLVVDENKQSNHP